MLIVMGGEHDGRLPPCSPPLQSLLCSFDLFTWLINSLSLSLSQSHFGTYLRLVAIWCGLSTNLEYRNEMCCTQVAENTRRKKSPKFAISAPSHNLVRLYLRN